MDVKKLNIDNVSFGTIITPEGLEIKSKNKKFRLLALSYIHSGGLELSVEKSRTISIKPGYIFPIFGSEKFTYKYANQEKTRRTFIEFWSPSVTKAKVEFLKQKINDVFEADTAIIKLIEVINLTDPFTMGESGRIAFKDYVTSIGISVLQYILCKTLLPKKFNQEKKEAFSLAVDFIDSHYSEEMDIKTITARLGISKTHLSSLFKLYNYPTPMEYLWQKRVTAALTLIRDTEKPYKEIADITGFNSTEHFYRRIKKSTKLTPAEYRKYSKKKTYDLDMPHISSVHSF